MINCKKGEKVIHIKSINDFDRVRTIDKEKYHKVYIVVDNDLSFDGIEFTPIDASGLDIVLISKKSKNQTRKKINNVKINNGDNPETGFFSQTGNFEMVNIDFDSFYVKGGVCTGGLVGSVRGDAFVANCGISGIVEAEAYCGSMFGTTKKLNITHSEIETKVSGKDIIGGISGIADSVSLKNNTIHASVFPKKSAVAQGLIVGYNSEEQEPIIKDMLLETLPLLRDSQTLEEKELIRSLTNNGKCNY